MTKSIMNFTKGVVTGVVVGTTVSMVMNSFIKPKSHKRNNGHIMKNIGSFVNHINDMMR